ncbi:hypothetical protein ABZ467_12550 [Streptomyces sp. NPDC005727]
MSGAHAVLGAGALSVPQLRCGDASGHPVRVPDVAHEVIMGP